ncbi:unnamed protein product, partial [Acanthoscelides obtectus]
RCHSSSTAAVSRRWVSRQWLKLRLAAVLRQYAATTCACAALPAVPSASPPPEISSRRSAGGSVGRWLVVPTEGATRALCASLISSRTRKMYDCRALPGTTKCCLFVDISVVM